MHLPEPVEVQIFPGRSRENTITTASNEPGLSAEALHVMSEQPATAAAPGVPVHAIAQVAHPVDRDRRRALLSHLIKSGDWKQVLVFMRTKHGANRVTEQLTQDGIDADVIHGNRSHGARARAIRRFKEGQLRVLVTTDMAARALNDAALAHVISFDLPTAPEEYLQRIRLAGNTGQAVALVCGEERELLGAIERHLQRDIGRKPVEGFEPGPGYETARYEPNPPQTPQTTSVEGTPGTASSEATPEQKPKHAPQTRQGQSPRKPEGQRGPGRPNHSRTQPPRKEDRRTAAPPEQIGRAHV